MTTNAIDVRGLSHVLNNFQLRDVALRLPTGAVMGLVGPNGAGKSTTIKAILGMIEPDQGDVTLFGSASSKSPEARGRIGVVLDQPFVVPEWRVGTIGRRLAPFYRSWDDAVFRRYLDRFGIRETSRVSTLSRGEAVKLSLAIALTHDPELLVLDEPSSGLDPASRADLVDIVREFMTEESRSVLFSTHITTDLDNLADLVTVMVGGRVAFSGTLDELHEGFGVVRGVGELPSEVEAKLFGMRREGNRFEGLVRVEDTIHFDPAVVIDEPTTDDAVVFFARHGGVLQEAGK